MMPERSASRPAADSRPGILRRPIVRSLGLSLLMLGSLCSALGRPRALALEDDGASAPGPGGGRKEAPKRLRRWTMIVDLRFCDGCQSAGKPPQCTGACIEGHFAPEPMQWIEVYERELPRGGTQFIPTPCQHCQNAPCVNACPVAATFATPEGVVLIDQQRCIGCRICMEACPYDRRFFNWGRPALPPEAERLQYDPEHQVPAQKGTVMKCNFCPHLARSGRLPYCAQACPTRAIYYGDLEEDVATNGRDLIRISRFLADNSGYRLKEHLGTEPRVFYIPGHGERAGRDPYRRGRKPTQWPWQGRAKEGATWTR